MTNAVVLLDLSSLVHPLYHVSSNESPDWTSDKALSEVRALASKYKHVAICLDMGRSFRKEMSPDYKANRAEKDATLIHQLKMAESKLRADGYPMWGVDGYEADDIIASAVWLAGLRGDVMGQPIPVVIASSDKDLSQLVSDTHCVTWMPVSGKAEGVECDEEGVFLKFGVKASQVGDYLALLGDASDNIKGVKGCGEKTAAYLLTELGSIAGILAAPGHSKQATRVCQFNHDNPGAIALAQSLVALRNDAAIDFEAVFADRVPDNSKTEDSMNELSGETAVVAAEVAKVVAAAPAAAERAAEVVADVLKGAVTDVVAVEEKPAAPAVTAAKADAIAIRPRAEVSFDRQYEAQSPSEAGTIAKWIHAGKMFSGFGSPEAVFTIMASGRELGMPTMVSLRSFHNIEGKATMSAEMIRARVLQSGLAEYFRCTERSAAGSTWVTKRKGDSEEPFVLRFSIEDATLAGLVKPGSNWAKRPADMTCKTASTQLARLIYPDVTLGLYCGAEMGGDE